MRFARPADNATMETTRLDLKNRQVARSGKWSASFQGCWRAMHASFSPSQARIARRMGCLVQLRESLEVPEAT